MTDLLSAIALLFAIEGLLFAAFPGGMKQAMRDAAETPERVLRLLGLGSAALGVFLVWVSRGFPPITFW